MITICQVCLALTETSVAGVMSAPVVLDAFISARASVGSKAVRCDCCLCFTLLLIEPFTASMHPPVSPDGSIA